MPHIVLDIIVDLEILSSKFEKIFQKERLTLIKINEMFVHHKKYTALFSIVVIDEIHQEYFVEVSTRESKTTARLSPLTDPTKKTNGVKKSLVLVYEFIKRYYPIHKITKTNLQDFISNRNDTV